MTLDVHIDYGCPDGDRTVLTRFKRLPCGLMEILDVVEVPHEPARTRLSRTLSAHVKLVMRNCAQQVAADLVTRLQRGWYLHAHKRRKPKRGWPGKHRTAV